jgi:hypothetical protein
VETLPKTLPGAVCAQWVRCGRPGCRCARGQPHGPYFYRFWREAGRLRKAYVRRADVAQVRARCRARAEERGELAEWCEVWRQLAALAREVERR